MKDSRIGESLWYTWEGDITEFSHLDHALYYTEGHVDLEVEVVRKALASSLQRDGISLSLYQGFQMIDQGSINTSYVGVYSDDHDRLYPEVCDENGLDSQGTQLIDIKPVTFVEVPHFVN